MYHKLNPSAKAAILMMMSGISFALMGSISKHLNTTLSEYELIFYRFLVSLFFTSLMVIREKKNPFNTDWNTKKHLMARGFAGYAKVTCYFVSLTYIPISIASSINWSTPVFVAILAPIFFNEKVSFWQFVAIILSIAGASMLGLKSGLEGGLSSAGLLIAIIGAVFGAFSNISVRAAGKNANNTMVVFYFSLIGTLCSLIPVLFTSFTSIKLSVGLLLLGMGVFGTFSQLAVSEAFRMSKISIVSSFSQFNVFFSVLLGVVLFNESLSLLQISGIVVLVSSMIYLVTSREVTKA